MISIEAENLSIIRGKKEVVKNLSFSVKQGEVFGLLGAMAQVNQPHYWRSLAF